LNKSPAPIRLILHGRLAENEEIRDAVHAVRDQGYTIEVRLTWEKDDAAVFAKEAAEQGYRSVVAAGGDGTVNETLQGLVSAAQPGSCALGVMALGTANDFAVGCGLPVRDPVAALQVVCDHPAHLVDIAEVNERSFLNVASGGYGAEITQETSPEAKSILGGFSYFLTGLTHATSIVPQVVKVRCKDFEWEGEALAVLVANGRQAGGGFQVAPAALINDGLLDLMIVPNVPWGQFMGLIGDLLEDPNTVEMEHVIHRSAASIDIEAPSGLHVNVDGEPLYDTQFHFTVNQQQLPLHIPQGAGVLRR